MTKKELWQTFLKTGRISDYIAYERAREDAPAQEFVPVDGDGETMPWENV